MRIWHVLGALTLSTVIGLGSPMAVLADHGPHDFRRPHARQHRTYGKHVRKHNQRIRKRVRKHNQRVRKHIRKHNQRVRKHVRKYERRIHKRFHKHVRHHRTHRVIEKRVYYQEPVWRVHHYRHRYYAPEAALHVMVSPHRGEVFIDGEYVGYVGRFDDGTIELPVGPGYHEVQLYVDGRSYTKIVPVEAGALAAIQISLSL
jgi:hypothetical protein